MKTSELTGYALGWAVSLITNPDWEHDDRLGNVQCLDEDNYSPEDCWAQGGPIIERERIAINAYLRADLETQWRAVSFTSGTVPTYSPTPLIAAMRCYVALKLGDDVEIPKELT